MIDDGELAERLHRAPLVRLVTFAGHVASQRFNREMNRRGLSAAASGVLAALARDDGDHQRTPGRATHAELARRCLISPGTLTTIVDTLERDGYVRRERDERDRRVVWLCVTEAGQLRAAEIGPHIRAIFAPTTVEQDPAKQAVIREYLIELIMTSQDRE